HFHEVGGIDAIVDIVGTALGIDYLGIERVVSAHVSVGGGTVTCSHGELPVPAPATCEILENVPVYGGGETELTTPTGAAIIKTLAVEFGPLPEMKIQKTGYGSGKRETAGRPNLLRILLGETGGQGDEFERDHVTVIEANIDDMNPEVGGYVMDKLLNDGALDVIFLPVFMKKNRPGTLLKVLCKDDIKEQIINMILTETSSIGLRYYAVERCLLAREVVCIDTAWGEMAIKKVRRPGGKTELIPEYEDCRRVAEEKGIPIREVYDTLTKNTAADRHDP
ncbi:MAG: nickel pincer cofactor biosynthesis protein LarC, partial [Gammaproteobacteria bacterium]|nr:nickel pincer cofactor biosynthesis protein LarC [Gammaproteobacteria bacterium]